MRPPLSKTCEKENPPKALGWFGGSEGFGASDNLRVVSLRIVKAQEDSLQRAVLSEDTFRAPSC